jgi:nitrate/nitrite-specific signal transduction histidine kinase
VPRDLNAMQTLVFAEPKKLLAALLALTILMLAILFLVRRDFIDPLRQIHAAIEQMDKGAKPHRQSSRTSLKFKPLNIPLTHKDWPDQPARERGPFSNRF